MKHTVLESLLGSRNKSNGNGNGDEIDFRVLEAIDAHPRIREAEEHAKRLERDAQNALQALERARASFQAAEERAAEALALNKPAVSTSVERTALTDAEILETRLALAARKGQQQKNLVYQEVQRQLDSEMRAAYIVAIRELDEILAAASVKNREVQEIFNHCCRLKGFGQNLLPPMTFDSLTLKNKTGNESKLSSWRDFIRRHGVELED